MSDTAYDELPYESRPIPHTAPEQLALVARYLGGASPRFKGCRYLEIGCGEATNALPLAYYRRADHYVGVDSSAVALASGRRAAEALGLDNLELIQADIADGLVELEPGFDFIMAHGVLSWISPPLRDALMTAIARLLTPTGIGYVSYNAMPGFGPRALLRESLLRVVDTSQPLGAQARRAREAATFIAEQLGDMDHPYAALMTREATRALSMSDSYIAHELIAPHNEAFWYGDFAALARKHGLEPIGDNWLYQPTHTTPSSVWEAVCSFEEAPDTRVELADLLRYKQLRCTLLRRDDAPEPRGVDGADLVESIGLACRGGLETSPVTEAAISVLAQAWPASVPWPTLAAALDGADLDLLKNELHERFVLGEVEWRLRDPVSLAAPPHDPGSIRRANALVRHEAARRGIITSPTHAAWTLSPAHCAEIAEGDIEDPQLLGLLDSWRMLA